MDNLTHTAVGLFLSRAGLNRWTPRATGILLLAANAPDVDVLSGLGGPLTYLHYHRHFTHSLLAVPFLAIASAAVIRLAGRKAIQWPGAIGIGIVGVLSHLLLDWTNVYGIRLLLPFSPAWLRLDTTGVVDLWIWAAAALGVMAPVLARLVGSEITSGSLRQKYPGRAASIFALAVILLYDCGRGILHVRAAAALDSRIYQGEAPLRVAAVPGFANPLRWRGLVETREFFALADLDLTTEFDPSRATIYQKPDPGPAIDAARRVPSIQQFLEFSQFPLWRALPVPDPPNGTEVDIIDLRFGTPAAPGFMVSVVLDERFHPVRSWVQMGGRMTKAD